MASTFAPASKGKDYSEYYFEGQWYKKARLPRAVVRAFVRDHPDVTYTELKIYFPCEIQGSFGVITTPEEARRKTEDPAKRYLSRDPIYLQDKTIVWVCSQWGAKYNFESFIRWAAELGYKIES